MKVARLEDELTTVKEWISRSFVSTTSRVVPSHAFVRDNDDDDEFVFAREVQFPHGAYKEKEKTKRKGTKETITKGHTPRKKSTVHA